MKNTIQNLPTETKQSLDKFFTERIPTEDFAQILRRTINQLTLLAFKNDNIDDLNKEWMQDSLYWLQDMAEFIDPCLERKKAPIKIS